MQALLLSLANGELTGNIPARLCERIGPQEPLGGVWDGHAPARLCGVESILGPKLRLELHSKTPGWRFPCGAQECRGGGRCRGRYRGERGRGPSALAAAPTAPTSPGPRHAGPRIDRPGGGANARPLGRAGGADSFRVPPRLADAPRHPACTSRLADPALRSRQAGQAETAALDRRRAAHRGAAQVHDDRRQDATADRRRHDGHPNPTSASLTASRARARCAAAWGRQGPGADRSRRRAGDFRDAMPRFRFRRASRKSSPAPSGRTQPALRRPARPASASCRCTVHQDVAHVTAPGAAPTALAARRAPESVGLPAARAHRTARTPGTTDGCCSHRASSYFELRGRPGSAPRPTRSRGSPGAGSSTWSSTPRTRVSRRGAGMAC